MWTEKGSPYIIQGEAIVEAGATLIIKPGTVIMFKTGENRDYAESDFDLGFLRVNGVIKASGTKAKPILFTRQGNRGYWGVVQIHSKKSGNSLKGCKFEYAYYIRNILPGANATGAVSVYEGTAEIAGCLFAKNGWTGINCKEGASPLIMNNTVVQNNYGIECNSESSPQIINTIVWGNEEDNFYVNGGSRPSIAYCLIGNRTLPMGAVDKGNNVMGKNPMFEDFRNYRLSADSPGIKAGKKKKNIGADL